jgi:preprotein translocase subunit SecG
MWPILLAILLTIVGFLLMFVILLQRGRGGGLAGALGGAGGQSAFGTKAGDVFTKITVGMAVVWVVLSGVTGMAMYHGSQNRYTGPAGEPAFTTPASSDESTGTGSGMLPGGSDLPAGDREDELPAP